MSFASQAREEIAQRSLQLQKDCCVRAAAYGIACFAKYFDARGLVLQTEQELTARVAEQLFARCGVQGAVLEKSRPSGVVYEFGIREPEQVRRMHELFGTTGSETSLQIDPGLIRCLREIHKMQQQLLILPMLNAFHKQAYTFQTPYFLLSLSNF